MIQEKDLNESTHLLYNTSQNSGRLANTSNANKNELNFVSPSTVTSLEALQEDLEKGQAKSEEETWEKFGRRTLYGSLPFMAAFGMQKKESAMKKVISAVSINTLAKLHLDKELMKEPEQLQEIDVDEITMTFHLLMAVVIAIISQFLVGFNTSVLNAPEAVVFPGHSTLSWSLAVSALAVGGPIGSIAGGFLANIYGRKGTMMINTWIFLAGGFLMTVAPSMLWLILSRFIIGCSSGVAMVVVPVYLGEIAPPTLRGTLGTCTQFAIVIGILFSNLVAFPLATPTGWRYMFAIGPFLSLVQLLSSPYLVESPRWLLSHDEHSTQARVEIKKLRAFRNSCDVEQEVQNYLFASKQHKTARSSAHSSGALFDLLKAKDIRILVVSSVVLQIAQQLSGINAVFYYSTTFFRGVIDNPLLGTTLIGIVNLLATILALKLMDNTERRTLLLWSALGSILAMLLIMAALSEVINRAFSLGAMLLFVTSFAVGLGPIPWLIVAEMFDSKYVATAMSLACIVNWTCNFIVGLSFPFCTQYLGPYSFAPFCFILLISVVFIYFYLPETHGKTIEEVYREVTRNRRSRSYAGVLSARHADQRKQSVDSYAENLVDLPVIQAVEMLDYRDDDAPAVKSTSGKSPRGDIVDTGSGKMISSKSNEGNNNSSKKSNEGSSKKGKERK
eukprot:gene12332-13484_t